MKRTSAFLELAERIMKHPTGSWFVCTDLGYSTEREWFIKLFKPTPIERSRYKHNSYVWLSPEKAISTENPDHTFRILCLLLAHEIWCDTIDKD